MDIPGLKAELEQHLKRNPHEDAPGGFRDRFEQAVEHYQAETDAGDKSELEAQLRGILGEAEAAANAACGDTGTDTHGDSGGGDDSPGAEAPGPGRGMGKGRTRMILAAVAAAAAAAFYFYSGSS